MLIKCSTKHILIPLVLKLKYSGTTWSVPGLQIITGTEAEYQSDAGSRKGNIRSHTCHIHVHVYTCTVETLYNTINFC